MAHVLFIKFSYKYFPSYPRIKFLTHFLMGCKATFRKEEEEALDGISKGVGISVRYRITIRGLIIRDRIIGRFP